MWLTFDDIFCASLIAAVLGNAMFGASVECVSSVPRAFELLFLLLIGATSFTEFDPEGQAGNVMDTFFKIFYCGLIPIIFQWILFEFFLAIMGDAFGEEKEIYTTLKLPEIRWGTISQGSQNTVKTRRKKWPRFEHVIDLLNGVKLQRSKGVTVQEEVPMMSDDLDEFGRG